MNQEKNGNNNTCQASEASSLAATGVASTASAKMEVDGAAATEAAAANGSKSSGCFGGQKAIKKGQISKDESVSDGRGVPSAVARLTQINFLKMPLGSSQVSNIVGFDTASEFENITINA